MSDSRLKSDRLCSDCDHDGHTCAAFGCAKEVDRLRAALDDAIRLAEFWIPSTGIDAGGARRELAELRAIANGKRPTNGGKANG